MIDSKLFKNDPEFIKKSLLLRGEKYLTSFEEAYKKDLKYKEVLKNTEELRNKRKEISKEIANLKIAKKEVSKELNDKANNLKEELTFKEKELVILEKEGKDILLTLPNLPDESVSVGKNEEDNKEIFKDIENKKEFNFKVLDHQEIGEKLDILDFQRAGKISGSRFSLLKDKGAKLERALIQFMLDLHTQENGYTEIFTPFLVNQQTMLGTGQLPKFEEDLYKINDEIPLYLIPTAEVPLTNLHSGEILNEKDFPIKYTAYSACFRRESGSYGKDTRGLIRNHQFNKVELVHLSLPENSQEELKDMLSNAQKVLKLLKLPYRIIELCTGDLGFSASKTYDLEVWFPSQNKFREISSCSNCKDFQARRMNLRVKRNDGKTELVHTLNGSGVAVGRAFAAILENYQQEDGSVLVPEVLRKYTGFEKIG